MNADGIKATTTIQIRYSYTKTLKSELIRQTLYTAETYLIMSTNITNNNSTVKEDLPAEDQHSHIRRSSLMLSPAWDAENTSLRHLGDLDDEDLIPVAYFPLKQQATKQQDGSSNNNNKKSNEPTKKMGMHPSASVGDWSIASGNTTDTSIYSQHGSSDDIWQDVPMGAPDAILGIAQAFRQCQEPHKVNVCVGAYRDDNGNSYVLPSVRAAEKILWENQEPKEYLPIEGDKDFVERALKFAYGPNMDIETHLAAVQTLSGTGACAIGGRFLAQFWKNHPIYVPDPTWSNHIKIFNQCGLDCRKYRYYNRSTNALDLEGMLEDLNRARDGSIILLHACAHNPTGKDLIASLLLLPYSIGKANRSSSSFNPILRLRSITRTMEKYHRHRPPKASCLFL